MTNRVRGTVVRFSDKWGYGFIKPDESEDGNKGDIFFHWSYLQMDGFKTVKQGSEVTFEIGHNHRGPMAIKINIENSNEQ